MCDPISASIAIAAAATTTQAVVQHNAQKKQENAQRDAMNAQVKRDQEAKAQAEAVGPAARKFDQVDQAALDEQKRKQLALQNGIVGTVKSDPTTLAVAPIETKKATLGA